MAIRRHSTHKGRRENNSNGPRDTTSTKGHQKCDHAFLGGLLCSFQSARTSTIKSSRTPCSTVLLQYSSSTGYPGRGQPQSFSTPADLLTTPLQQINRGDIRNRSSYGIALVPHNLLIVTAQVRRKIRRYVHVLGISRMITVSQLSALRPAHLHRCVLQPRCLTPHLPPHSTT